MSRPATLPDQWSDVVIVGGGAAGLCLALQLTATATTTRSVVVVEPPEGPSRPRERTWCFWDEGSCDFEEAISASWSRLRVHGTDGREITVDPVPLRYRMLRSTQFEQFVHARLAAHPRARVLRATAGAVRDTADGAAVSCVASDGRPLTLRARHLFDSRPLQALPPARTCLLQHFRGWFVRTAAERFDPTVADLMDFRVPQPRHGLAFGYVLPLASDRALIEYTEFSRAPLTTAAYEASLGHYCREILRLGAFTVEAAEQGAIPMTDARFPRRIGPAVFRIGTAGGATRPATGYTFAAAQRQSRAIADALEAGRPWCPRRTGDGRWPWTRYSCGRWTPGGSMALTSSPTCSAGSPRNGCCASWTVRPRSGRSGPSDCAPPSARCCAPPSNFPFCPATSVPHHVPHHDPHPNPHYDPRRAPHDTAAR